jgi:hypothetical protein
VAYELLRVHAQRTRMNEARGRVQRGNCLH